MSKTTPLIAIFFRTIGAAGGERVMLNLANEWLKLGLRVDLVLSTAAGLDLWEIPANLRIIDLKASRLSKSLFGLANYLKQERPAILIPCAHFANEVALLAKLIARIPGKIMLVEHIVLSTEVQREETGIRKRLIPLATRTLYPLADQIIAVSPRVAEDLAEMTGIPQNKIPAVYNPAITPQLYEQAAKPVEHPWFKPGELPVILGVGRLQSQKDFPTLIRAFDLVRKTQPARLVILGWGPDRPQLESFIQELGLEDCVDLLGFVSNPYAYMKRASVFVLSSAWEGMPLSLIEAMGLSIPVVATDCKSGPAEILNNGEYGNLVPVGDSDAIASAILEVLSGRIRAVPPDWLNQFRVEYVAQKYLALANMELPTGV